MKSFHPLKTQTMSIHKLKHLTKKFSDKKFWFKNILKKLTTFRRLHNVILKSKWMNVEKSSNFFKMFLNQNFTTYTKQESYVFLWFTGVFAWRILSSNDGYGSENDTWKLGA